MNHRITREEVVFSFKQTIPVLLGYIFLGIAFGLLMSDSGYSIVLSGLCSIFVYAGSMQFVLAGLFLEKASMLTVAFMTIFVNGRHIFYGLSFVEKFKKQGKRYPYLIASLTDETYSVLCNLDVIPKDKEINTDNCIFLISLLNHTYWITGTLIGALAGALISLDTTGIDFSMTALFTVIVINQWMDTKDHLPAICGGIIGLGCLLFIGADKFLLPALFITACILIIKGTFERNELQHKECNL